MDKAEERHELVLEELIQRLAKKPGFLSIHEEYFGPQGTLHGEMDLHLMRRTTDGRVMHRYYEVKARYSDGSEERAWQQFERHKKYHKGQNWKYILYTPELIKQIKL